MTVQGGGPGEPSGLEGGGAGPATGAVVARVAEPYDPEAGASYVTAHPAQPQNPIHHASPTYATPAQPANVGTVVQAALPMTVYRADDAPFNLVIGETTEPFARDCLRSCGEFCCWFITAMIAGLIVGIFLSAGGAGLLGTVILSLVPAAVIAHFAYKWYGPYLTRCSMHVVFFTATLYIVIPLSLVIFFIDRAIGLPDNCKADEDSPRDMASFFVQAFLRAGLLEETIKYVCIRVIMHKDYVTDARAVMVYACLAGTAFGVVENIGYGVIGGLGTVFLRSFLTVFAHSTTGLLMGTYLAEARFLEGAEDKWPWYRVLLIPVLGHGTYDVLLFIQTGFCDPPLATLVVLAFLLFLAGLVYTRRRFVAVLQLCPQTNVDVHQKIAEGDIQKPCLCAPGCFDCCPCCY